ncbi:serine hydrolase [Fulvivirga lutea]|uniref:Serine hydrolase n=1 Tax=Fulvivirga lutea TaxID=2810512 RepID=A0A974WHP7_9BACT|nr:serine hydrolase [Fulvivirga lutea]QSE97352.1 serine hydrolase [Fulvivirga lutea]
MIRKVYLTFLLLLTTLLIHAQTEKSQWVDSVYASLTLDQRLGQLMIFPVNGNGNGEHKNAILNTIDRYTLGGFVITSGNPKNVAQLNNELRTHSRLPLLSFAHTSNGLGDLLDDAQPLANTLTLASVQNKELIKNNAYALVNQLKNLGINVALNSYDTPFNSQNTSQVSNKFIGNLLKVDSAYFDAFQSKNVRLGKAGFPSISGKLSKKELEEYLNVYKQAFANRLEFISLNHLTSSIDQKSSAAVSKSTYDYLRKNLDFKGFILSEDLENIPKYKPGKTEAQALLLGSDLLVSANINSSIKQMKKLIRKGDIPLSTVEKKVKKLLSYKYDLSNNHLGVISKTNVVSRINNPCASSAYEAALLESITYLTGKDHLPIKVLEDKNFASLSIGSNPYFQKYLSSYSIFSHYNHTYATEKLKETLALFDHIVIGLFDESIDTKWIELINSLDPAKIILCSPIRPELTAFNSEISKLIYYTSDDKMGKLLPQSIFGASSSNGRLPITLGDKLTLGSGENITSLDRLAFKIPEQTNVDGITLSKIDEIAKEAIKSKATPGCQVLVARKGSVIYNKSFGYHTYDSLMRVDDQSIYDLASITKVAATTQAIMFLEERQVIDLDKKVSVYLEDLKGTNKENMTIRDILTHQAGLWPFLPFWKETLTDDTYASIYYSNHPDDNYPYQLSEGVYISNITKDSVWQWVKASKLRSKAATATYDYKYSDMGYYIMQRLIEKSVNQPMEEFLQQNFYDPMGLSTLSYLPLCKFPQNLIVPTENDNYFRKTLVNGMVHDQGAALVGGVAGHAGLFSNALDLAKLAQMNLQGGYYGGHEYFMKGTLDRFTSVQYESNRRGIGWDKPVVAEWNSPTSVYASKKSFGHTGFTGTAVWVDPEFDLVYVFLSNRIYPDADNVKLIKNNIRTRIQDLIYQAIWKYEESPGARCN